MKNEKVLNALEDFSYYILNYGPLIGFFLSLIIGIVCILYGVWVLYL